MIFITFKGVEYVIPYDRETLKINLAIDSTFDNGYFETTPIEFIEELDVTRRIPRNILVRILYDEQEFIFKTGETHVQQLTYGDEIRYKHRINLVSLAKDLTRKPLENITVTQPKGDFGVYTRAVNVANVNVIDPDPVVASFTNTVNTDPSKIDGMELISIESYQIALNVVYTYRAPLFSNYLVTINIRYNGVIIRQEIETIQQKVSFRDQQRVFAYVFNYTPVAGGTFSVDIDRNVTLADIPTAQMTFTITSIAFDDLPVRTYTHVIDKILARSEYVLSPLSRDRLNITAPEQTFNEYTIFDALTLIGGNVGALVRVGGMIPEVKWRERDEIAPDIVASNIFDVSPYEYDVGTNLKIGDTYYTNKLTGQQKRTILFEYFDRPNVFDPMGVVETMEQAELEDYVSAIELNTKNVIKPIRYSPFRGGWKSLRNIGGIGQFTTESIGYETEDAIERPIKVLIRGIPSRNAGGTITYDENDVTDITERVLEKTQWDTLPSQADYTLAGKFDLLKNNTLYYVKGDNKIYGMSYIGDVEDRVIGEANVTRSIYEVVLATRSVIENERMYRIADTTKDDGGVNGDLLIEMQIEYSNITESRARLYKDDQSGFDTELIKYFNESSNVNESNAIGTYAQQIVNRLGGTKISYTGIVDTLVDVPKLGDVDSAGRVYTIIELGLGKRIKYKYTLVQDYNVISSYIGIQSRHRVEEIPSDSNVVRTLRYVSKFIFTTAPESFSTRLIQPNDILESLFNETSDGITYGYMDCLLPDGQTKRVHLSIDSDSKGKTIEIKWMLPTAYSAGLKRYSFIRDAKTIWLNLDVPYTDYYGRVNAILFALYYQGNITDLDAYPEATASAGDELFVVVNDTIDKDAREILAGLVEIPILSEHPNVRVFDGFARWNKLVEGTDRIRSCALQYVPIKNAIKVDLSRTFDVDVTGTLAFGQMGLSFELDDMAKGIAFYNIDTLDLLFAYINDFDVGTYNIPIYYKIIDSEFGGGQNASTLKVLDALMTHSVAGGAHIGGALSGDVVADVAKVVSIGQTYFVDARVDGLMTGQTYDGYGYDEIINAEITKSYMVSLPINKDAETTAEMIGQSYDGHDFAGDTESQTTTRTLVSLPYYENADVVGAASGQSFDGESFDTDTTSSIAIQTSIGVVFFKDARVTSESISQSYNGESLTGEITSSAITTYGIWLNVISNAITTAEMLATSHDGESFDETVDANTSTQYGAYNSFSEALVTSAMNGQSYDGEAFTGDITADTQTIYSAVFVEANANVTSNTNNMTHVGVLLNGETKALIGGSWARPQWVLGGSVVSGDPVCNTQAHIGNVKMETVKIACNWNEVNVYQSLENLTTFGVQCSTGAERTECTRSGGVWVCTDFVGEDIFNDVYETCTWVGDEF